MTETICGSFKFQFIVQRFRQPYAFLDLCGYKLFALPAYEELIPEVVPCVLETLCIINMRDFICSGIYIGFECCQDGGDNHSRESRCRLQSESSGTKRIQPGTTGSGKRVPGTTGKGLFSHLCCINSFVTAFPFLIDAVTVCLLLLSAVVCMGQPYEYILELRKTTLLRGIIRN
jgi:hypothetical protein